MKAKRCEMWLRAMAEFQREIPDLPLTVQDKDALNSEVYNIQKKLQEVVSMPNLVLLCKLTHKEKRQKVVELAVANPALSIAAIARHFGFSEAFVAKVFDTFGSEINARQRGER